METSILALAYQEWAFYFQSQVRGRKIIPLTVYVIRSHLSLSRGSIPNHTYKFLCVRRGVPSLCYLAALCGTVGGHRWVTTIIHPTCPRFLHLCAVISFLFFSMYSLAIYRDYYSSGLCTTVALIALIL